MRTNLSSQISLNRVSPKYYKPENAVERSVLTRCEKVPTDIYETMEEGVQEVFVKVWETRDFLRADDNFKGYLFIITRNLIFNQFRKSFNENAYKLTVLSAAMDYYDMEDELSAADLKEFIKRMVGGLPPRQQEVFKMSRDEHLTYKEIATRLNISEKTVERHINEAIKFLKKNIMLYLIFIF